MNERIGVPRGTRLIALWRVPDGWQVWTAVKDPTKPHKQWKGTFLLLKDDGEIVSVTHDEGHYDEYQVRPPQ